MTEVSEIARYSLKNCNDTDHVRCSRAGKNFFSLSMVKMRHFSGRISAWGCNAHALRMKEKSLLAWT